MSDVLTPEQRSKCMSRIRSKNTKPELIVRKALHSLGLRFRIHLKKLPGNPDIVLPKHRTVILVHGCFFHLHRCKYGRVTPHKNAEFWRKKRMSNVERDRRNIKLLKSLGWRVIVIWECWAKRHPDKLLCKIEPLARLLKK